MPDQDTTARPVRVSSSTKIKPCVAFALEWFDVRSHSHSNQNQKKVQLIEHRTQDNLDTPLVFHTLPYGYLLPPDRKKERTEPDNNTQTADGEPTTTTTTKKPRQEGSTRNATTDVPRLISIVEIVKREFLRNLAIHHSPRLAGLHQYTEIGCLEDLPKPEEPSESVPSRAEAGADDADGLDKRAKEVVEALSGKNQQVALPPLTPYPSFLLSWYSVRVPRTPYMKITLSLNPIPTLAEQGARYIIHFIVALPSSHLCSYQPPTIRKISKSAKSRAKKKAQKQQAEDKSGNSDDRHSDPAMSEG